MNLKNEKIKNWLKNSEKKYFFHQHVVNRYFSEKIKRPSQVQTTLIFNNIIFTVFNSNGWTSKSACIWKKLHTK